MEKTLSAGGNLCALKTGRTCRGSNPVLRVRSPKGYPLPYKSYRIIYLPVNHIRCMVLSSSIIRARLIEGTLGIEPFAEESLQPSSYDLRSAEDIIIRKGELTLVPTMEFVRLPSDLCATLWGRSSFGRKGVVLGAGYIDPGFRGNLTLCMVNHGPEDISVTKGMRVVQMLIHPVEGTVESAYNGNYQDSYGVVQSKL